MCGIAGYWRFGGTPPGAERLLERMTRILTHRGPDGEGFFREGGVGLGMRRLAIIDIEGGAQPVRNEEGDVTVVYNGEIYNHAELRGELERIGHRFSSRCDSEVIPHAYEEWGDDFVRHLNGMFAFALWDRKRKRLLLARDRLGIKPLYYLHENDRFLFGSEIKAILEDPETRREVDRQSLYYYIGFEFVPAPATMFRGISKLPPGEMLVVERGRAERKSYWTPRFERSDESEEVLAGKLLEHLRRSVRRRMMSDVPLGAFLSGGVDSTAVVALMREATDRPLKTFTIGFKEKGFSELPYAELAAKRYGVEQRVILLDPVTPETLEKVVWHLDEPMTDLSTVPLHMLCEAAREDVTVVLSGEGGDELLAGYDRFRASKANRFYQAVPSLVRRRLIEPIVLSLPDQGQKKGAINILKRFVEGTLHPARGGHMRWQYFSTSERDRRLFNEETRAAVRMDSFDLLARIADRSGSDERVAREIYVDLVGVMPDSVLMKVDKMSMAHSLEIRVPFLDHELVDFLGTVPSEMKLKGFTTKAIFRKAAAPILPPKIVGRGKQGYSFPIKEWLREEWRGYMTDLLLKSEGVRAYTEESHVRTLIEEHLSRRANHNHVLWALMNFSLWHRRFIENAEPR